MNQLPALLLPWFDGAKRALPWRADRDPYHVWLSEIMLQQTRVEAVKPYYQRFLEKLPDIPALSECEPDTLMKLWEGLGYYSRARNLQKAAIQVMTEYGGEFPRTYDEIHRLSGVGDYTAGAISSICFDLPEPAVDGNVLRVYTRLLADGRCTDDPKVKREIRAALQAVYQQCERCGDLTQALMELGAIVCVPTGMPRCEACPLRECCMARAQGNMLEYPVRKQKKPRRIEHYTVYTLQCGDYIAVQKRPDSGLLAGLWELPHVAGASDAQMALHKAEIWALGDVSLCSVRNRVHIFTHIEWHMTCVHVRVTEMPTDFHWITAAELEKETALPAAFRICLPE